MALNKQWLALLIIAIMVASYGALFAFQGGTPSIEPVVPNPTQPNNSPTQTTPIHFTSEPFQATVQSVLPTVFLTGSTQQAEIGLLDQKVYAVSGVRNVKSFFRQLEPNSLIYVAEIQLDSKFDRDVVIQHLSVVSELTNVQLLGASLIQSPETLQLNNPDLNVSQSHTFKNRSFQLFSNLTTQSGDLVQANLSLDLAGDVVSNVNAIELVNFSSQPSVERVDWNESVSAVQNRIILYGSVPYNQNFNRASFDQSIESVSGISSSKTLWKFDLQLAVFTDANLVGKESDLNRLLMDLNGVRSLKLRLDQPSSSVTLGFVEGTNLDRLKVDVVNVIKTFQAQFHPTYAEPNFEFLTDANTDSNSTQSVLTAVNSFAATNHITLFGVAQFSQLDLNEFYSKDLNQAIPIDGGHVNALTKLGRSVGETIPLRFKFTVLRNKTVDALAVEDTVWFSVLNQQFHQ